MKKPYLLIPVLIIIICLVFTGYILADRKKKLSREYDLTGINELTTVTELDGAEVRIRGGNPKELKAWIYYNDDEYDADIYFEKARQEAFVSLDKRGFLKKFSYNSNNVAEVFIELPTDIPVLFKSKIFAGSIDIDMGNIRTKDFDLKSTAGEFNIDFATPNQEKIEKLYMDLNFGQIHVRRVGNANFKYAKIDAVAGELEVDLSGEYTGDAEAVIDMEFGQTTVYLPRNVGVKLSVSKWWFLGHLSDIPYNLKKRGKYYYSSNFDTAEHQLLVRIQAGTGEINIRWE